MHFTGVFCCLFWSLDKPPDRDQSLGRKDFTALKHGDNLGQLSPLDHHQTTVTQKCSTDIPQKTHLNSALFLIQSDVTVFYPEGLSLLVF